MVYLYTMDNCPKCEKKKKEFISKTITFEERDSSRIKTPQDSIDQEALVQASFTNMEFPVIVII